MIDVVEMVRGGGGRFEWTSLTSKCDSYELHISVMRDAMKFDDMPAMTWNRRPIAGDSRTYDGVRMAATAHELQQIADILGAMLMTPKVIDLLWLRAGVKFDSVVNVKGQIVAVSNVNDVHEAIEAAIKAAGGDDGTKIVSCVGKYWCLEETLNVKGMVQGDWAACNYGWFAKSASGPGLTPGTQCWQRPGYRHNKSHQDPSQVIRLMARRAHLIHPDGTERDVDLHDVAQDENLCGLLTHNARPLTYLRQRGVPKEPLVGRSDPIVLPEITIYGESNKVG